MILLGFAIVRLPAPKVSVTALAEAKLGVYVPPALCVPPVTGVTACPADHVLLAFSNGIVAPLVPVLSTAAVPNDVPFVFRHVTANVPDVVQSPLKSPLLIVVDPENFVRLPLDGEPVVLTLPPPDGVAHVPSPRQKVDDDADVPALRLFTDKLPVTCVARFKLPEISVKAGCAPVKAPPVLMPVAKLCEASVELSTPPRLVVVGVCAPGKKSRCVPSLLATNVPLMPGNRVVELSPVSVKPVEFVSVQLPELDTVIANVIPGAKIVLDAAGKVSVAVVPPRLSAFAMSPAAT